MLNPKEKLTCTADSFEKWLYTVMDRTQIEIQNESEMQGLCHRSSSTVLLIQKGFPAFAQ